MKAMVSDRQMQLATYYGILSLKGGDAVLAHWRNSRLNDVYRALGADTRNGRETLKAGVELLNREDLEKIAHMLDPPVQLFIEKRRSAFSYRKTLLRKTNAQLKAEIRARIARYPNDSIIFLRAMIKGVVLGVRTVVWELTETAWQASRMVNPYSSESVLSWRSWVRLLMLMWRLLGFPKTLFHVVVREPLVSIARASDIQQVFSAAARRSLHKKING